MKLDRVMLRFLLMVVLLALLTEVVSAATSRTYPIFQSPYPLSASRVVSVTKPSCFEQVLYGTSCPTCPEGFIPGPLGGCVAATSCFGPVIWCEDTDEESTEESTSMSCGEGYVATIDGGCQQLEPEDCPAGMTSTYDGFGNSGCTPSQAIIDSCKAHEELCLVGCRDAYLVTKAKATQLFSYVKNKPSAAGKADAALRQSTGGEVGYSPSLRELQNALTVWNMECSARCWLANDYCVESSLLISPHD